MALNINDPYMAYYRHQMQAGGGGITQVYRGAPYQKGHGIGSFLGGVFRTIAPLLKSGAKTLGKEALRSGIGFLGDISGGTSNPREAAASRFREFTGTLKRKADDKLGRVLSGGGSAHSAKLRRVARGRVARKTSALRANPRVGGRRRRRAPVKKKQTRRVTPQSLARLLRVRTSTKRKTARGKKRIVQRRDIFD